MANLIHLRKATSVLLLLSSLLGFYSLPVMAQEAAAAGGNSEADIFSDSMRDVYTVAGVGLGGAILGLSTLSFVEEPKEHLRNILIGGSIGIILGVGLVAWQHASRTQGVYESVSQATDEFATYSRVAWHNQSHGTLSKKAPSINSNQPYFTYNFSF